MNTAFLAEPASWLRDTVVQVRQGPSAGSGLTWAFDVIVTNAHVASSGEVEVQLPNGEMRRGVVRACDPHRDIAVLYVPGLALPRCAAPRSRAAPAGTHALRHRPPRYPRPA